MSNVIAEWDISSWSYSKYGQGDHFSAMKLNLEFVPQEEEGSGQQMT